MERDLLTHPITEADRIRAAVDNAVQETIARLEAEHEADRVRLVAKHAEEVHRLEATIASQGETIKMLSPQSTRGQS